MLVSYKEKVAYYNYIKDKLCKDLNLETIEFTDARGEVLISSLDPSTYTNYEIKDTIRNNIYELNLIGYIVVSMGYDNRYVSVKVYDPAPEFITLLRIEGYL